MFELHETNGRDQLWVDLQTGEQHTLDELDGIYEDLQAQWEARVGREED